MMIEKIGKPAMYEQLAEECAELAKESLKMARVLRGENPTPRTEEEVMRNIVEEASDVDLCLSELGIEPDIQIQAMKCGRFLERWEARQAEMKNKIRESMELFPEYING